MPRSKRVYCEYCDIFLPHDSRKGRKGHREGRAHRENVRAYWETVLDSSPFVAEYVSAELGIPPPIVPGASSTQKVYPEPGPQVFPVPPPGGLPAGVTAAPGVPFPGAPFGAFPAYQPPAALAAPPPQVRFTARAPPPGAPPPPPGMGGLGGLGGLGGCSTVDDMVRMAEAQTRTTSELFAARMRAPVFTPHQYTPHTPMAPPGAGGMPGMGGMPPHGMGGMPQPGGMAPMMPPGAHFPPQGYGGGIGPSAAVHAHGHGQPQYGQPQYGQPGHGGPGLVPLPPPGAQ